ncbi:redoxin family protein, partial [bacterium]|nr:redoxin family protein [bacterium]
MKNTLLLFCACMVTASLLAVARANRGDDVRRRILRLFPKVDTNADGVISEKEEEAFCREVMLKFPKADADSDGVLSTKEKYALLNMAAQKKRNQIASDGISVASAETTEPEEADSGTKPVESPVRRGPQLVKPGEYGIGKQIEQLLFKDINGQTHSLSDFADQTAIVIAMTGTGCPLCLKYAPTLANIERQYRNQSVKFIFVNPNQSEQLQDLTDAVQTHGFRGPYVQDANRKLPLALKANTTTEVFVLDRARTLVYQGAVDDQYGFGYALQAPRRAFLVDALDAVLEGRTPAIQATTSPGCELSYQSVDAAETPITYHNRISRIIQANCLDCHRTGGTAPMAFERYDAVKDYAGMIADVVERKIMPPWFAAPTADQQHDGPHALH